MVMLVKPADENALSPIVVSEAGRVMLLRALQPENAPPLIDVRLLGRVTLDKFTQLANVFSAIVVKPFGKVTDCRRDLKNALTPMLVSEFGK